MTTRAGVLKSPDRDMRGGTGIEPMIPHGLTGDAIKQRIGPMRAGGVVRRVAVY